MSQTRKEARNVLFPDKGKDEHLTQKEQDELAARYSRVIAPPMGWVCPKCGSVMAPHMSVCPNCSVQPTRPFAPYPGYPPEVTCGLRSATGDEHILAGGHQSAGPR